MSLKVIGAGIGRTGTYSLRLALNQLELGPCYHMEDVIHDIPGRLPGWQAAAKGSPDWPKMFVGFNSAVDWPVAGYFREMHATYPDAKFVLTVRSPDSWASSFSETIYMGIGGKEQAPPHMHAWIDMALAVVQRTGFPLGLNLNQLAQAFTAHTKAVVAAIPASKLLVYEVKDGWAPLCKFLGQPVPDGPFPVSNSRAEFWERIKGASG